MHFLCGVFFYSLWIINIKLELNYMFLYKENWKHSADIVLMQHIFNVRSYPSIEISNFDRFLMCSMQIIVYVQLHERVQYMKIAKIVQLSERTLPFHSIYQNHISTFRLSIEKHTHTRGKTFCFDFDYLLLGEKDRGTLHVNQIISNQSATWPSSVTLNLQ